MVREAARRTINMRHFDVQVLGAIAMFHGSIAEMETGEGKTLAATMPLYLRSLTDKGTHLTTVNDYLARRDAEWMEPIYKLLGLSVGVIQTEMLPSERSKAYGCDVTYGTAKEFGFDFLKDRLLLRHMGRNAGDSLSTMRFASGGNSAEKPVQREAYFAVVDEADSILIDEARTPLIISALPGEEQQRAVACYQWSAQIADQFVEDEHYKYDYEKRKVELTLDGCQLARTLPKPDVMNPVGYANIYEYVERAIKVRREFLPEQHFVVREGQVVIVDEYTGRLSEGRKWSAGIHQAVEAMAGVDVTVESDHAARITVQDYFLRYQHLAGMTGTASSSARELRRIYHVNVTTIPTNRPLHRKKLPHRIFSDSQSKWAAIVDEVRQLHQQQRPVLIGTRSIDKSELLSRLLVEAGIEHQVLNARHIASEAEIVAQAGQPGRVTVATNMAGRGTDIKLGEGVAEKGGLHVICTEMHNSNRIDRQLIGRSGRQGDPGTARQFLSLDDEILRSAFGPRKAQKFLTRRNQSHDHLQRLEGLFRRAQAKIERLHFRARRILLYQEKLRKKMQREMGQDPYLDTPQ